MSNLISQHHILPHSVNHHNIFPPSMGCNNPSNQRWLSCLQRRTNSGVPSETSQGWKKILTSSSKRKFCFNPLVRADKSQTNFFFLIFFQIGQSKILLLHCFQNHKPRYVWGISSIVTWTLDDINKDASLMHRENPIKESWLYQLSRKMTLN